MEALTAEFEEEVEEEEEEEESAEAAESEEALDEQQWSGEEPELDSPQAQPVEQAEAIDEAQDLDLALGEAASAAAESSLDRDEEEAEGGESPETALQSLHAGAVTFHDIIRSICDLVGPIISPYFFSDGRVIVLKLTDVLSALKMDSDKQGSEKSGSMSPDSIGSEKRPEESFEPQMQGFFAGERVVPESPTMDMPSFVPPIVQTPTKESARSLTLQPTYGEPITVSEKQPSVEVVEISSIGAAPDLSSQADKVQEGDSTSDARDRSGMSAYFETSTMGVDEAPQCKGEGYYELSRSGEKKSTDEQEISYSTLAGALGTPNIKESTAEDTQGIKVPDRSNECRLSPASILASFDPGDCGLHHLRFLISSNDH
ncbi:hypothetical protein EYF80_012385 [Liparis tanakae]|uniref:Uncharacterized protein n=1 Tax=Liparis tanakae TaxID=230148 RepID=A0A4Z2II69_9TELE|nr:hypothetical protein EYF80_012385 [Liparis tanakae]